jgi:hypothetical protein
MITRAECKNRSSFRLANVLQDEIGDDLVRLRSLVGLDAIVSDHPSLSRDTCDLTHKVETVAGAIDDVGLEDAGIGNELLGQVHEVAQPRDASHGGGIAITAAEDNVAF